MERSQMSLTLRRFRSSRMRLEVNLSDAPCGTIALMSINALDA
jgi:hypothetical protein